MSIFPVESPLSFDIERFAEHNPGEYPPINYFENINGVKSVIRFVQLYGISKLPPDNSYYIINTFENENKYRYKLIKYISINANNYEIINSELKKLIRRYNASKNGENPSFNVHVLKYKDILELFEKFGYQIDVDVLVRVLEHQKQYIKLLSHISSVVKPCTIKNEMAFLWTFFAKIYKSGAGLSFQKSIISKLLYEMIKSCKLFTYDKFTESTGCLRDYFDIFSNYTNFELVQRFVINDNIYPNYLKIYSEYLIHYSIKSEDFEVLYKYTHNESILSYVYMLLNNYQPSDKYVRENDYSLQVVREIPYSDGILEYIIRSFDFIEFYDKHFNCLSPFGLNKKNLYKLGWKQEHIDKIFKVITEKIPPNEKNIKQYMVICRLIPPNTSKELLLKFRFDEIKTICEDPMIIENTNHELKQWLSENKIIQLFTRNLQLSEKKKIAELEAALEATNNILLDRERRIKELEETFMTPVKKMLNMINSEQNLM